MQEPQCKSRELVFSGDHLKVTLLKLLKNKIFSTFYILNRVGWGFRKGWGAIPLPSPTDAVRCSAPPHWASAQSSAALLRFGSLSARSPPLCLATPSSPPLCPLV